MRTNCESLVLYAWGIGRSTFLSEVARLTYRRTIRSVALTAQTISAARSRLPALGKSLHVLRYRALRGHLGLSVEETPLIYRVPATFARPWLTPASGTTKAQTGRWSLAP